MDYLSRRTVAMYCANNVARESATAHKGIETFSVDVNSLPVFTVYEVGAEDQLTNGYFTNHSCTCVKKAN